jgi:hypothetical protein
MLVTVFLSVAFADDSLSSLRDRGFRRVSVRPSHNTSVALRGLTAVIFDAPPYLFHYSITTTDNQVWTYPDAFPYGHLLLSGDSLSPSTVSEGSEIPIWILPKGFCSNGTIALRTE